MRSSKNYSHVVRLVMHAVARYIVEKFRNILNNSD